MPLIVYADIKILESYSISSVCICPSLKRWEKQADILKMTIPPSATDAMCSLGEVDFPL